MTAPVARPWETRREPIVLKPARDDLVLWIVTSLLVALGLVMVFNTSYFFARDRYGDPYLFTRKHLMAAAAGVVVLLVARRAPTAVVRRFAYPLLAAVTCALALVLVPGVGLTRGGARRWFELGGVSLQPSEAAKPAIVLYLAHSLAKKGERLAVLSTGFLPHVVVVGIVAGLVALEPDYGTTVLMGVILFVMLVGGGARWKHLAGAAALALPLAVAGAVTADYRWQRLASFVDPWADSRGSGFQLVQSLIAFGSGGVWGVGLGAGRQKMFYLPGAHTDFVFSVIGEELGLVGALAVVGAFALVALAGFRLAWRHPDPFASQLAFGLTALIVLQAAVNMAVAVGLLPTKGIALPFLSYGGSALVMSLLELGLLLGVAREARWGEGPRPPAWPAVRHRTGLTA